MDQPLQSPYPLGIPVTDTRLLQLRRAEIETALEAVAPSQSTDNRHALLMGEQRSGRTSVLREVARRAADDRGRLIVPVCGLNQGTCTRQRFLRQLLTAVVEALAAASEVGHSPWYGAWRDRVYLGDRSASTERDLLSSALLYATDPESDVDPTIIERDLRALLDVARGAGFGGIVLSIDDASPLTEDTDLVEELVGTVDSMGGYRLLMACLPSTAGHFVEAASPCLARFIPVWLRPFRGLHQIVISLGAPLTGQDGKWVKADDVPFLLDVLRLTGGNPYELMLVGHHLWLTCQRGEQDRYALTPRVLDRVIPHLSVLASGGDALLDGAEAIDRLPEEHVRQAVELAALSRLSVREIAITRILKINGRDTARVDRAILVADIDAEGERVRSELEELQDEGIVQLHPDGERFNVVGGRPAAVLLKYKARARIGADVSNQPFELNFLSAAGPALVRDATVRALEAIDGSGSLGFSTVISLDGAGRLSPRPAIRALSTSGDFARLVQAEIDLIPWGARGFDRIAALLTEDDPAVGLVYTAVSHGREHLEYTELWELPPGLSHERLAETWSGVTEEWQPVVAAADLNWTGSEFAVLSGERARQVLIVLQRYAATSAVHELFDRWLNQRDGSSLERAQQIADEAVATMRTTGLSESELAGELSGMLSRSGFLKSFDDARLDEARGALEEALRTGTADSWVTKWNLANVAARQGDGTTALAMLDDVAEAIATWTGHAFVLVFVPGRPAVDSLVKVTEAGTTSLLELQQAVIATSTGEEVDLSPIIERCASSEDAGAACAANWVAESASSARQKQ